ncbi:MAG: ABC transporter ATP-binding protein [Bacillota bacterium]|nr:ABC transporter ATP-binding protein [Bacillota bacterium]
MAEYILEVKDLKTRYVTRFRENVYAVDGVSFKLKEGETLGIAGESGCGKSTLAMSLMGYYFPPLHYTSGSIIIDGRDITGEDPEVLRRTVLGTEIAYIPQAAMNALNPTRKIIKYINDVLVAHNIRLSRTELREMAEERMRLVNLPVEVLDRYPVELSGGMKQRTVIAISSLLSPKILIADEPSSALDVSSQKLVIKMLLDLIDKGLVKSMIFITHELPLLYNVTKKIAVMYAGQFVEMGPAHESVFEPLHPYAKGLMGSIIVPSEGIRDEHLVAVPGTPPNLKSPPQHCRFAARCKFRQPLCDSVVVPERFSSDGRLFRCLLPEAVLRELKYEDQIKSKQEDAEVELDVNIIPFAEDNGDGDSGKESGG